MPPWVRRPVMNHGCLHIHPFWLIWLSDFTGVRRLQSRMFMLLSCHVCFFFFAFSLGSQRRDWLCWKLWGEGGSPPNSSSMKDSGHERNKKTSQLSFSCILLHGINSHASGFSSFQTPELLIYCDLEFIPPCHALQMWRIENETLKALISHLFHASQMLTWKGKSLQNKDFQMGKISFEQRASPM